MGVSPYYRGADCNFWALYDSNYHLVGSTIHYLSKGIDSGDIIYLENRKPIQRDSDQTEDIKIIVEF